MSKPGYVTLTLPDGGSMDSYVAYPGSHGTAAAVIILQEAFGVNHHIRSVADRVANMGYVAIAPELFHRTGRNVEIGYTDFPSAQPHMQALTVEGLSADLRAVYQWLQGQDSVNKDRMAAVGFCLGGRVSFLANTILPLSAAVSYYGGGIKALADRAGDLHGEQLFFWGGLDKHIPQDQIDEVIQAVKHAGKSYTNVVISDADHGFNCDEKAAYNERAAKDAWALTTRFLAQRLGA